MAETSCASFGFTQGFGQFKLHLFIFGDDNLSDAVTVFDDKVFLSPVDQRNTDLAAVVTVDGTDAVDQADTFF